MAGIENPSEELGKSIKVEQGETVSDVANKLWIKLSAIKDSFTDVQIWDRFGLVKRLDGRYHFTRERWKVSITLEKESIFQDEYTFPGFTFSLKKDASWYGLVWKKGGFYGGEYRIPSSNIGKFQNEFEKISGIIITKWWVLKALNSLKYDASLKASRESNIFPDVYEVESTFPLDLKKYKIDMAPFRKLIKPELTGKRDLEILLSFFLENFDINS
jgi:hypothetical protein